MTDARVKLVVLEVDDEKAVSYSQISRVFAANWFRGILPDSTQFFTTDTDIFPIDEVFFQRKMGEGEIFSSMRLSPTSSANNYTYLGLSGVLADLKTWRNLVNFEDCKDSQIWVVNSSKYGIFLKLEVIYCFKYES